MHPVTACGLMQTPVFKSKESKTLSQRLFSILKTIGPAKIGFNLKQPENIAKSML